MGMLSKNRLIEVFVVIKRAVIQGSAFLGQTSGSVAVIFSISLTGLLGAAALAIDYTNFQREQTVLQGVADAAAISGARSLSVANNETEVRAVIASAAMSASDNSTADMTITETVDATAGRVEITITKPWKPLLSHLFVQRDALIVAKAAASLMGGNRICILGLNDTLDATIALSGESKITANGCAVISNSTSASGIGSYKSSLIKAKMICSAGGVSGGSSNFSPAPIVDCPRVPDPLRSRMPPPILGCDHTNYSVSGATVVLSPGVYCGGLLIANGSDVTFGPGEYVIKDGSFSITHNSKVYGKYVGFYLTGSNARFLFAAGTQIELHAPRTGVMAGLLFYEDPNVPDTQTHEIVSDNARVLVGTIYLPKGIFRVGSKQPVADLSAYTAIIANKIELNRYPSIVLNSNYDQTDVPVPANLTTGIGRSVRLSN